MAAASRWAAAGDRRSYDCRIPACAHRAASHAFTYRSYSWLVDLDAAAAAAALAAAAGRASAPPIILATRPAASGRTSSASGRARHRPSRWAASRCWPTPGYSGTSSTRCRVYWCHAADGCAGLRAGRGAQHLRASGTATCCGPTSGAGPRPRRSSTSRRSIPWTGDTRCRCPSPATRLALTVTLHRPDGPPFVAASGASAARRRRADCSALPPRHPWPTRRGHGHGFMPRAADSVPVACAGRSPATRSSRRRESDEPATQPAPAARPPPQPPTRHRYPGPRSARRAGRPSRGCPGQVSGGIRPPAAGMAAARPADVRVRACLRRLCSAAASPARRRWCSPARGDFFRRIGASGLIGFGESYMAGDWTATTWPGCSPCFARRIAAWCRAACSGCGRVVGRASRLGTPPRGRPAEHPPALRPVQRHVRAVPRRDHDLLGGLFDRQPATATDAAPRPSAARSTGSSTRPASARAAGSWRSAPAGASWPSAPPPRGAGARRHPVGRAARPRPAADRRGRAVRTGSTSSCATTAR